MANKNLSAAKNAKNDEFYTLFADIQKEINAYIEYNPDVFRGKVVLCPCDLTYVFSMNQPKKQFTKNKLQRQNKRVFPIVLIAHWKTNQIQKKSGQSKTWTLTMFQHGAKAEKQILKIVRCFVKLIIAQKETNKKQWIRFSHWIIF